ncbi:hypothetical protein [Geoalkalibacter sp.]|uniref:hypothetical protein n=1 Tax=Geoalkalibacter sp. TaxID=3041440 RepID=UPI00272DE0AF|nr:hypothetical protein [Geoalkalibacter sp.]
MLKSRMLVDYRRFRTARVLIFVDVSDGKKAARLLREHGEAIERLTARFSAQLLMAESALIDPERIVEQDVADAWLLLRLEGPNRALATRKYPQYLNLDARPDWENYAFQELVRQIRETRDINDQVAGHYNRYSFTAPAGLAEESRPGIS